MATTANGTPYVESSDLVANYPAVSLALAEHIDDTSAILQVVRATDTTDRTTTSASLVDVTGMAVTITPQRNTSAILLISSFLYFGVGNATGRFTISDSSNNAISGAQEMYTGSSSLTAPNNIVVMFAYATPATTSPVTHKLRFQLVSGTSISVGNAFSTGQMFAIEVSA